MLTPQLTEQEWLRLPMPVRVELVKIFNLNRSRGTVVEDGVVKSDGYTHEDLKAITLEGMQKYLDSAVTDFYSLFNEVLKKVSATIGKERKETTIQENYARVEKYIGMVKELRQQCHEFALGEVFDTRIAEIFNIKPHVQKEKKQNEGGVGGGSRVETGTGAAA